MFRRDRKDGHKGGGLCAYVRNNIECVVLQTDVSNSDASIDIEIMWIICHYHKVDIVIDLCYHPPAPRYHSSKFVSCLSCNIDFIMQNYVVDLIAIAGDFNSLDTQFISNDYGFVQIVKSPTHGDNLLTNFLSAEAICTAPQS